MRHLYRPLLIAQRYVLIVTLLLTAITARAQAPGWDGAYPGSTSTVTGTSTISAVATDARGNVFVTGNFTSTVIFGNTVLTTAGGSDLFVAKYVPSTNTWAWAQRGGGTSADAGNAIAVSGSSVYVTGSIVNNTANTNNVLFGGISPATSFTVVAGASSTVGSDLVVARYTDTGNSVTLDWTQVGGGTGGDDGSGVAVKGSSVYVAGTIYNDAANSRGVVFGGSGTIPGTALVRGASTTLSSDLVLAKYTDTGSSATLDWTQVGGGTGGDTGNGVAVSVTSVYVAGTIGNTKSNANAVVFGRNGDGIAPAGTRPQAGASNTTSQDVLLAKYTDTGASGSFEWSQVGGGTNDDRGYGVAVSGNSVYVAGVIRNNTANTADAVLGGSGLTAGTSPVSGASVTLSADLLLLKYTDAGASGSFGWSQVGGGTDADFGRAIAASGNRVYVAGQFSNSASDARTVRFGAGGTTTLVGIGSTVGDDQLLICYTDNGSIGAYTWGLVGGGTSYDYAYGVAVSGQQVYMGGTVIPPATYGPVTITTANSYSVDVLARATDPALTPLAVRADGRSSALLLYPNPTRAAATLAGAPAGMAVQVFDVLGRVVATTTTDATGQATLDQLPAGFYLVRAGDSALRLHVE